jgi:predicted nucleic-acid-binding protein
VWVLEKIYKRSREEIALVVERLLQSDNLILQNEQQVAAAITAFRSRRGSFADALVGALGIWAGCSFTLTFDRKAERLPGFQLL